MSQPLKALGARSGDGAFAPLGVPVFFALWSATILSNFGTMIQTVGAAWTMTTLAGSPFMVALVQTASTLPIMLLGLPAGALADLYDRRIVMIWAQLMTVAASAALALLGFLDLLTPWTLLGLTFALGAGGALNAPTWQAALGDIVPRQSLASAVALNSLSFNTARSVGPALGGLIVSLLSAPAAFLINAIATLPLLGVLLSWKNDSQRRDLPAERLPDAMWTGVRYVALSPSLLNYVARGVVIAFCGGAMWALLPLLARDQLHGGPAMFGVLLGFFGLGALSGAFGVNALRRKLKPSPLWDTAAIGFASASVAMGLSTLVWLTAAALIVAGAAWLIGLSTIISGIQLSAPRWVVGRAIAMFQLTAFGALAIGSALWGLVANHVGLAPTLYASAAAFLTSLLALRRQPLPDQAIEIDLAETVTIAEPSLRLEQNSEPVVVTVNYKVAATDADRFRALMREASRMRRRDGALGWELLQDIDAPDLWVERFHSISWLEHRRRRSRALKSDQTLRDQIALFAVEDGAKVRRFVRRDG